MTKYSDHKVLVTQIITHLNKQINNLITKNNELYKTLYIIH